MTDICFYIYSCSFIINEYSDNPIPLYPFPLSLHPSVQVVHSCCNYPMNWSEAMIQLVFRFGSEREISMISNIYVYKIVADRRTLCLLKMKCFVCEKRSINDLICNKQTAMMKIQFVPFELVSWWLGKWRKCHFAGGFWLNKLIITTEMAPLRRPLYVHLRYILWYIHKILSCFVLL